jgi:hypothetical protein
MLLFAAAVLMSLFALAALVDAIWFHLFANRLFARAESRYEHVLHTIHAGLFPVIIALLFLRPAFWPAVAVIALDFAVELLDVICERDSRASLGGLSTPEYAVHAIGIGSFAAGFALALAARPAAIPPMIRMFAIAMIAGGVVMTALHVAVLIPSVARAFPDDVGHAHPGVGEAGGDEKVV